MHYQPPRLVPKRPVFLYTLAIMKAHYLNAILLVAVAYFAIQFVKQNRPNSPGKPALKHSSASIAFLNLGGAKFSELVAQDRAAFGGLFTDVPASPENIPTSFVLFLYSSIDNNGALAGSKLTLRQLISKSQAKIVVLASENSIEAYLAAMKLPGDGHANLVLTTNRKGQTFAQFFAKLFRSMLSGKSMPSAWVELAPQGPNSAEQKALAPDTAFAPELGQVSFTPTEQ